MDISKRAAKYAFATVLTSLTLGTLATPPPAQAATLTGVIASTITLTGACAINGSVISAVGSSFGTSNSIYRGFCTSKWHSEYTNDFPM